MLTPRAAACLLVILPPLPGAPAVCQTPGEADLPKVHVPFVMHYGVGSFSAGQVTLRAFSARSTFKLRRYQRDRWGLRLRLTGVVGTYDFRSVTDLTVDHLQTVALVPGLEFQIPLGDRVTLRPFQDLGPGRALDDGRTFLVSSTGILSEFVFPWKGFEFGIEPSLKYSFSVAEGDRYDEDFGDFVLAADARHLLWFDLAGYTPVLGVYVGYTNYFDDLVFGVADGTRVRLTQQYDVGVAADFAPQIKVWFLRIPRVSVGWAFGDNGSGIRIRFGDRVTHLPSYDPTR